MKIEHLAIWVSDLERMKSFYTLYFEGKAGERYYNPNKQFTSYFISFSEGCRLELMHSPLIPPLALAASAEHRGLIHFAISVGSKEAVNRLTEQLSADGFSILGQPRTTGDGYYESVVADPEGNRIEITI